MGSNMLILMSSSTLSGGVRTGAGSRQSLTWDDLKAIEEEVRSIRHIAPLLSRNTHLNSGGENWGTSVQGTTPAYFELRNWSVLQGAFFTENEVRRSAKVAVLGKTVAESLFPDGDPLGEIVRVDQTPFVVIGIAASKGSGGGGDEDDRVFVPVSTFQSRLRGDLGKYLNGRIYIGADSAESTAEVQSQLESLLRRRHEILDPDEEDDFRIYNMEEQKQAQQQGMDTMASLLAGIALVSLVVGGIGIMNIMLVSVTERTREIGLRMAVGAKPRDILTQFMIEAVSLSVVGGALGLAAGLGGGTLVSRFMDLSVGLDPQAAILALGSSAVVGIGFGLYPAFQASRLDPIQALRYE